MSNIDRNFLLNALAWLLFGMVFGFWMGASGNLQYLGVHVVMMLTGFVTLAIYGCIYRLWPDMKRRGLARLQFWLAAGAVPFTVLGSYLQVQSGSILVLAAASAVAIVAAALLAWLFWTVTSPV